MALRAANRLSGGICVLAVMLLAGCQMADPVKPAPKITLLPDADGLLVLPDNLRIDFGRAPSGVIPVLDRELGAHKARSLSGCPTNVAAHLQWADLVLVFTTERFVGWRQGMRSQGRTCAP